MSSLTRLWCFSTSSSSSSSLDEFVEHCTNQQRMFVGEIMDLMDHGIAESSASTQGGSVVGRKDLRYGRDYTAGHNQLIRDYFAANYVYGEADFRQRFRMSKTIFNKVLDGLSESNIFFTHRRNEINELGISPLQKVTAELRTISYGTSDDLQDDKIRIRDSTAILCMKEFCKTVVCLFGDEYLRSPTPRDIDRLLAMEAQHRFPAPPCNYKIRDKDHFMGYYLVDGIYPKWKSLVQAYKRPDNAKEAKFTKQQGSLRKDVERVFGILQGRFHILRKEVYYHDPAVLSDIMYCCIILRNMIVEEERGEYELQLRNYPDIAVEF